MILSETMKYRIKCNHLPLAHAVFLIDILLSHKNFVLRALVVVVVWVRGP